MRAKTLHFAGVVPINTTIERSFLNSTLSVYRINVVKVLFLVGQTGSLFVRPVLVQPSGSRINLLFPDPGINGDDVEFSFTDFDLNFNPGATLLFVVTNTSTANTRRYNVIVKLETLEVGELV